METVNLEVMTRKAGKSSARKLREQNIIPAVVYGKGLDSLPIAVQASKFREVYKKHGHSTIINLVVNGSTIPGIIKEVQYGVPKGDIIHVDFLKVSMTDEIEAQVVIRVEGVGIIEGKGGIVEHHLRELTVRCVAQDLPEEIVVDVSGLKIGDVITVGDIKLKEGIKVLDDPKETILSITVPKNTVTEEERETARETETPTAQE